MLQNLRKPLSFRPQVQETSMDKALDQVFHQSLAVDLPEMEDYPDWLGFVAQDPFVSHTA